MDKDEPLENPAAWAYRLLTKMVGSENVNHEYWLGAMAYMDSPPEEHPCTTCGRDLMKSGWVPIKRGGKYFCSPECAPASEFHFRSE